MNPFDYLNKPGGLFLMNLLSQSGYSTMPDSPIGAVGRASLNTRQQLQNTELAQQRLQAIGGGVSPSNIREWEYYNNLSAEDQQRYLTMKRANQTRRLPGFGVSNTNTPDGAPDPLLSETDTVSAEAGAERAIRGAGEAARQAAITDALPGQIQARTDAERRAAGAEELGDAQSGVEEFIAGSEYFIDALESGELQTGPWRGLLPAIKTKEQLFEAWSGEQVLDRISSVTLGALSEGEMRFLKSTVTGRTNTPEANIKIIQDKIATLRRAEARARRKAGGNQNRATRRYNPETGRIEDI